MVVRKRRKKNSLRGKRSHGKGNTKNKRGAGCRGGRGRAGSKKHKRFSYAGEFGVKKKLKTKQIQRRQKAAKTINLDNLNLMLKKLEMENKLEKEAGYVLVDGEKMNFDKLLGRGTISFKIKVKHLGLTKKAIEKIEAAQGAVEMEEVAETEEITEAVEAAPAAEEKTEEKSE
jgi:large subunit ribosomal protein L15